MIQINAGPLPVRMMDNNGTVEIVMGTRITRRVNAQRRALCTAEARWQAALRKLSPEPPELFSDRQDEAVEVECILRDFERVHDEALGVERYA
ncbi:MAG: hypothetical protein A3I02_08805 [Betaproteobacteria bacterium RIFCSPLOWO2_02_FULL_67_26]|nr:MAG: hypothetical protein A3I02_08805 [Betaproteobacteria bacterium RIFCSPLOWO2_02_FULL_67_26]